MKIIEVPVFNEDGSIKFTQVCSPEEAQSLLQFALNFLTATGMNVRMLMSNQTETPEEEVKVGLND